MTKVTENIDKYIIIRSPLDMEGTLLVFLRNIFKLEIFPGLKWSPHKDQSEITIDVADRINQVKTSDYPAIFVSMGTLSYQTVGLRDGFEQYYNMIARTTPEDRAIVQQPTVKQTVTLQQFPIFFQNPSPPELFTISLNAQSTKRLQPLIQTKQFIK